MINLLVDRKLNVQIGFRYANVTDADDDDVVDGAGVQSPADVEGSL